MTQRPEPVDPKTRAARSLQALAGILFVAAGAACYDWRAGLIAFGALTLLTSAVWRTTA